MTVATNIYLEYWKKMVLSADVISTPEDKVTFFVFTDNVESVKDFKSRLANVEVCEFEIPPYRWPDATLLRYQVFSSHFKYLKTDILMHLDADMIFQDTPWARITDKLQESSICLVEHPGFWRPNGIDRFTLYVFHPRILFSDIRIKIKNGGVGSWETNFNSKAFIERKRRLKYYCGGIWFGKRKDIGELNKTLSDWVDSDLRLNLTATYHDESHLNRWATINNHGIDLPEMCFVENYPQIKRLKPIIMAVIKTELTR